MKYDIGVCVCVCVCLCVCFFVFVCMSVSAISKEMCVNAVCVSVGVRRCVHGYLCEGLYTVVFRYPYS